ncbi:uncharacterized protein [Nicotiana sylvestris]|uniref:uncharacterized protein n=1 Tax=Nicotiana sylvestris TaxID=4096 RepID=UPI00388C6E80
MFYYPRPIPQDVLIEEQDNDYYHQGYSGSDIYEWFIDGLAERHIYTIVHRMLMYNNICKVNKNRDRAIAEMIIAGFTSQLKGWWDNYLTHDQRFKIMNATKTEEDKTVQNSVYSLVMNIIEHFSKRWFDNSETIRMMLQNLRCKTLTSFRWYKDVFLSRVMELPESNSTHWESKFIDGLPPLFAERIRKALRGTWMSVNYDTYSYGKLFSVCTQEGLTQKKSHKKKDFKRKKGSPEKHLKRYERTLKRKAFHKAKKGYIKSKNPQACYKCGHIGHYAKDCKVKDKIKDRDLDDSIKESLYKILFNSSPELSDTDEDDSSTNLNINILTNDSMIELLRVIKDPELRSQIIDKLPTSSEEGTKVEEIPSQKGPYTMFEIIKMVKNKSQPKKMATVQDLRTEINYLKKEISELKASNVALDERIFKLENFDKNLSIKITETNTVTSSSEEDTANTLLVAMDFSED